MAKKFKMLSFVQICGVQSFRVAANVEALAKAGNIRTNVQLPTNAQ